MTAATLTASVAAAVPGIYRRHGATGVLAYALIVATRNPQAWAVASVLDGVAAGMADVNSPWLEAMTARLLAEATETPVAAVA